MGPSIFIKYPVLHDCKTRQKSSFDLSRKFLHHRMVVLTSAQPQENGLIINDLAHRKVPKSKIGTISKDSSRMVLVKGKNHVRLRN